MLTCYQLNKNKQAGTANRKSKHRQGSASFTHLQQGDSLTHTHTLSHKDTHTNRKKQTDTHTRAQAGKVTYRQLAVSIAASSACFPPFIFFSLAVMLTEAVAPLRLRTTLHLCVFTQVKP